MTQRPPTNFGKRKPPEPLYEEPSSRKRSNQVALLLMGTLAVGGGAYALMPGEQCDPNRPTIEQPGCRQSGSSSSSSSSGSHYYGGGTSWGGSSGSSTTPRSNFAGTSSGASFTGSSSSGSSVSRSGFGSFASHFSGGG